MEHNGPILGRKKGKIVGENDDLRLHSAREELDPWTTWDYIPHTLSLFLICECVLM